MHYQLSCPSVSGISCVSHACVVLISHRKLRGAYEINGTWELRTFITFLLPVFLPWAIA